MKKHLLLLILLILPICVYASAPLDYNNSIGQAEAYINKGNYTITHERYIKQTSFSHFISKEEYDATKGEKSKSYLFDGTEYWTSTGNSSTHFIVNYSGNTVQVGNNDKYNTRDVEYINDDVAIIGRGTYANPWTFAPMYEIKFVTDTRYGYIKEGSAELASKTIFVTRNDTATITMSAKTGFSYITNNCGATFSNGELKLEKVKRNTTCTVVFGTGKYKVTLADANPNTIYVKYNDNFYRNDGYRETISKVTPPNRTGYTFKGYYFEGTKVIDENGNVQRSSASKIYKNVDLIPTYELNNPATPTISASGASAKIYYSADTTLTCATSTTYASGAKKYYEFGYSTVDGGNPTTWSSPSESATYTIAKDTYVGDRYYSCRVQVKDSTYNIESSVASSSTASDALVRYNNATITFNGNNGTVSGTSPLYTRYGQTKFFTGIRNSTTATTPSATRTGYTFGGWYDASSGGTQYYDGSGINKKSFDKAEDMTMYAHFKANALTFNNQTLNAGNYGTAYTSNAFTASSNGTGSYTYTLKSGYPTGATIDSANRKISFTNTTPVGTYKVVVHAKDDNSGSEKDATMTIVINKVAASITCSNKTYTGAAQTACTCSGGTIAGTYSATAVGTYTAKCTPDDNHTSAVDKTWTMNKKAITVTAKDQTVTYGNAISQTASNVTAATLVSGHTLSSIKLTQSTTNCTTNGTITPSAAVIKSGTKDVSDNYSVTYKDGTLKINKSNTTTSLSAITKTYNTTAQAASGATAKLSSNSTAISGASFTYKYYSNSTCTKNETSTAPTNAGTHYVKATLTATDNYNSSTSDCATYTMNKAKPDAPKLTSKTYNYDGNKHCVGHTDAPSETSLEYKYCTVSNGSCGSYNSFGSGTGCGTNVGSWKIKARVKASDNYLASDESNEATLTIKQTIKDLYICRKDSAHGYCAGELVNDACLWSRTCAYTSSTAKCVSTYVVGYNTKVTVYATPSNARYKIKSIENDKIYYQKGDDGLFKLSPYKDLYWIDTNCLSTSKNADCSSECSG